MTFRVEKCVSVTIVTYEIIHAISVHDHGESITAAGISPYSRCLSLDYDNACDQSDGRDDGNRYVY